MTMLLHLLAYWWRYNKLKNYSLTIKIGAPPIIKHKHELNHVFNNEL